MKKLLPYILSIGLLVAAGLIVGALISKANSSTGNWIQKGGRVCFGGCGFNNGFRYSRTITVGSNASSTQTNFPMLVCFNASSGGCTQTLTDLKTVANGGRIQSSTGLDIMFTSDSAEPSCFLMSKRITTLRQAKANTGSMSRP